MIHVGLIHQLLHKDFFLINISLVYLLVISVITNDFSCQFCAITNYTIMDILI